jgi:hypothetical protein
MPLQFLHFDLLQHASTEEKQLYPAGYPVKGVVVRIESGHGDFCSVHHVSMLGGELQSN